MLQEYGKSSQEFEAYPIHNEMEIFKSIPMQVSWISNLLKHNHFTVTFDIERRQGIQLIKRDIITLTM